MFLQNSQGRLPRLSKNRCRINISIAASEYERNIQPISQCYVGTYKVHKQCQVTIRTGTGVEKLQNISVVITKCGLLALLELKIML